MDCVGGRRMLRVVSTLLPKLGADLRHVRRLKLPLLLLPPGPPRFSRIRRHGRAVGAPISLSRSCSSLLLRTSTITEYLLTSLF